MNTNSQMNITAIARIINSESSPYRAAEILVRHMRDNEQGSMIQMLGEVCHEANKNWWLDLATGEPKERNIGELLMLCVSELAEAMEGHRKDLMDDKLPQFKMFDVELADCLIRIFDLISGPGVLRLRRS